LKHLALFLALFTTLALAEPSVLTQPVQEETRLESVEESANIDELFSNATQNAQGVVLSHAKIPSRLYVGEIFPLTLKLTPTDIASGNIEYTLQGEEGISIFSQTPARSIKSDGVYDTFYFLVTSSSVRLPDISATTSSNGAVSNTLMGSTLGTTPLNAPASYANVLADSFKVTGYKTTAYDQESNIVVFSVKATRCNIASFNLVKATKQGFESKAPNVSESSMTYYAIIPNSEQTLEFSIFNLKKNRYESISIPIVVDDDTVSTQSDLSPTDSQHTELKVGAAAIIAVVFIALFYWRRSKWLLYASVLPLFYVVYALLPNSNVCVKKDSPVYLLPIKNGTIFEMTMEEESLEAENVVGEFTKIHLTNNSVGWVHEKDLCSN
jgi:hypothetical protein